MINSKIKGRKEGGKKNEDEARHGIYCLILFICNIHPNYKKIEIVVKKERKKESKKGKEKKVRERKRKERKGRKRKKKLATIQKSNCTNVPAHKLRLISNDEFTKKKICTKK